MKNSKLQVLMSNSKLPSITSDMISLDAELIKTVKGGILAKDKNKGCQINNGTCGGNQ